MLRHIDQQLLNLAFSGLEIGIAVLDENGNVQAANDIYRGLQQNYPQENTLVRQTIQSGKPQKNVMALDDGTWIEQTVCPVPGEKEGVDGYISYLSDVTERETMIEALRLAKEEVTQDIRLEDIFINNLNHEIRTPLNAIIGFNDVLNGVSGHHMEEHEKQTIREHIHKNANRLITIINDILDFSKMEKGSLVMHKTVVSLMEVCCRARDSVKGEVQKGVKLQHEYPTALRDTQIYTDAKRLEQLLRNVLSNACRHTLVGTITLRVSTFTDELDGQQMLRIRVDDTGVGIPHEHREHIFNSFGKVNHEAKGLGMGLAICKQIAKMLDGHIYLDHDYIGGSSFVLEIPLVSVP